MLGVNTVLLGLVNALNNTAGPHEDSSAVTVMFSAIFTTCCKASLSSAVLLPDCTVMDLLLLSIVHL